MAVVVARPPIGVAAVAVQSARVRSDDNWRGQDQTGQRERDRPHFRLVR